MYKRNYYRGDIWFVREGKAVVGSEPHGNRPAVIVSNNKGNKTSPNVEVVFLTTKNKKYLPTHVPVLCKTMSIALCENVQTIPKDHLQDYVRSCTKKEMRRINQALLCSFGLEDYDYKELCEGLLERLIHTGGKYHDKR